MTDLTKRLDWEPAFLAALSEMKNIKASAKFAGIHSGTAYSYRKRNARFAAEWEAALAARPLVETGEPEAQPSRRWRALFFEALAETSNVTASAARANIPLNTVYKFRREDSDFAARWQAALAEGYDNLEMELVGYLRDPAPAKKMDVAAALRLLAAHRETVERRRSLTEEEDEQATVASLDAFFEGLKRRRLANEALLKLPAPDDDGE